MAQRFAALLDRPGFDKGGVAWVSQATRVSHGDEKQHREDAIRRLGDHRLPPGQRAARPGGLRGRASQAFKRELVSRSGLDASDCFTPGGLEWTKGAYPRVLELIGELLKILMTRSDVEVLLARHGLELTRSVSAEESVQRAVDRRAMKRGFAYFVSARWGE